MRVLDSLILLKKFVSTLMEVGTNMLSIDSITDPPIHVLKIKIKLKEQRCHHNMQPKHKRAFQIIIIISTNSLSSELIKFVFFFKYLFRFYSILFFNHSGTKGE